MELHIFPTERGRIIKATDGAIQYIIKKQETYKHIFRTPYSHMSTISRAGKWNIRYTITLDDTELSISLPKVISPISRNSYICRSSIRNASSHTKDANMAGNTTKNSITYTPVKSLRNMNDIPVEGEYLRLKNPEWIWLTLSLPRELPCNIVGIKRGRWEVLRSGGRADCGIENSIVLGLASLMNALCRLNGKAWQKLFERQWTMK